MTKRYRPTKSTKRQLVIALRAQAIWKITQPGMPSRDRAIGYSCQLCRSEWTVRQREQHKPHCVLA